MTVIYLDELNGKPLKQTLEIEITDVDKFVCAKNENLGIEAYGSSLEESVIEFADYFEDLACMLSKKKCEVENAGRLSFEFEKYVNIEDYSEKKHGRK